MLKKIQNISSIDPWFLEQIYELIQLENKLSLKKIKDITPEDLLLFKKKGFTDIKK